MQTKTIATKAIATAIGAVEAAEAVEEAEEAKEAEAVEEARRKTPPKNPKTAAKSCYIRRTRSQISYAENHQGDSLPVLASLRLSR